KAVFHQMMVHPGAALSTKKHLVILEENSRVFHVHSTTTGMRDRRLGEIVSSQSHSKEVLAACMLRWPSRSGEDDSNGRVLLITSGLDKTLRFWDGNFTRIKIWEFPKTYIGSLCWAAQRHTLFGADHFGDCVYQWTIASWTELRTQETPTTLRRIHADSAAHSSTINRILWIDRLEAIVTAGMDKKIILWDTIQCRTLYELSGAHTKGVMHLAYSDAS
ncbi:hypothetical protein FOZ61_003408, partial [Perkinsus olseni]